MTTAQDLLSAATATLSRAGVPTASVDAELLLAHVTGRRRMVLRLAGGDIPMEQRGAFEDLVAQRAQRVPLQHLTGRAPFRHLDLQVGPGVFIPRPETELMVDEVLRFASARDRTGDSDRLAVVDLCSGSAAVALAIGTEIPRADVVAVELSLEAAAWARRNLAGVAGDLARAGSTVVLEVGDARLVARADGPLGSDRGTVDVVVANPPYVPIAAVPREPEVADHDPALALYGGDDGLDVIRALAGQAALLLRPGGLLVVEHGESQGDAAGSAGVPGLLRERHLRGPGGRRRPVWCSVRDLPDLAGRPRHTVAIRAPGRMTP